MGAPHLDWDEIPLAEPADTNGFALTVDGTEYFASAVSVGNPHCIVFVEDASQCRSAKSAHASSITQCFRPA